MTAVSSLFPSFISNKCIADIHGLFLKIAFGRVFVLIFVHVDGGQLGRMDGLDELVLAVLEQTFQDFNCFLRTEDFFVPWSLLFFI